MHCSQNQHGLILSQQNWYDLICFNYRNIFLSFQILTQFSILDDFFTRRIIILLWDIPFQFLATSLRQRLLKLWIAVLAKYECPLYHLLCWVVCLQYKSPVPPARYERIMTYYDSMTNIIIMTVRLCLGEGVIALNLNGDKSLQNEAKTNYKTPSNKLHVCKLIWFVGYCCKLDNVHDVCSNSRTNLDWSQQTWRIIWYNLL